MVDDLYVNTASALQVSIGQFARQVRQSPLQGEFTLPEMSALSRLERAGSATTADLARAEQISPQGMGATLARLEERGFLHRRPDPSDGRRVVLSVTDTGRQALRSKYNARTEQLARALAVAFTPAEVKTLLAAAPLIERLGESL
jgi:DNA-binding MarR family transcriptional regulator